MKRRANSPSGLSGITTVGSDWEPSFWQQLGGLRSALVADAADSLGFRDQCMSPGLLPVNRALPLVGTIVTLQTVPVLDVPADAFIRELEFLDTLVEGDVIVASAGLVECAFWGELLTTVAMAKGAAGAVIDGWIRDADLIAQSQFTVVCRGSSPYDSIGRLDLANTNVPIACRGVRVNPGDIILADSDGVVVLPRSAAAKIVERAEAKSTDEDRARRLYAAPGARAVDVFREHGIL